jgi:cellobiose phosphorylase
VIAREARAAIATRRSCLLSNGAYRVMLTDTGGGVSRWRDLAVTRWRDDAHREDWGSYLLLRDEHSGAVWSPTRQPFPQANLNVTTTFRTDRAEFARRCGTIDSILEIAVAHDADIELRRLHLVNRGDSPRSLSLTSYSELVLGNAAADDVHPAFSKMFMQTEWDRLNSVLLATRRKRDDAEPSIWLAHALQVEGTPELRAREHDSDRNIFLGRGRTLHHAHAMRPGSVLTDSIGSVLDPIVSVRHRFLLPAGAAVRLLLWTRLAESRKAAMTLSEQLRDADAAEKLFLGASGAAATQLQSCGIDADKEMLFARWLSALFLNDPKQRYSSAASSRGVGGSPTLWAGGISGDRPIILMCLRDVGQASQLADLLLAQTWWRRRGLGIDVVLLNMACNTAGDEPQRAISPLVSRQLATLQSDSGLAKAELFALRDSAISAQLRNGLFTVARLLIGTADTEPSNPLPSVSSALPVAVLLGTRCAPAAMPRNDPLEFANGRGGFAQQGRAYRIELNDGKCTPAPWVNVIANPSFGFLVSAEGSGYTWSLNSQQNPLTPWPNDPVSDRPSEVLYLYDEEDGEVWSATALPIRVAGANYAATHGKGWTRFECNAHGVDLELTVCVPTEDSLKLSRLYICNRSGVKRNLSITSYVEWALGPVGSAVAPYVVSSVDTQTGALFVHNPWRAEFGDRIAFIDLAGKQHSLSGDRAEFLGQLGTLDKPAALTGNRPLSGQVGAGLDPCGALQTRVTLPPHTDFELVFCLGDAESVAAAQALVEKYRAADFAQIFDAINRQWNGLLDAVQVRTPDRAMDILLNDWLLYQVLSCRVWARTAYYQVSGAYGFRDQLQDVMALCVARPSLAREHLLRAAGRQFVEGDVQHWWLPPNGQGIRTKITDDRVWLAYVAAHYVGVTGDGAILDESVPFLSGPAIARGASDAFFMPTRSDQKASLYEHCARALDSSLTRGAHGLPLIGSGDWNDGLNAVGRLGRGESTWLGWLLLACIAEFCPYAETRGETARARRWRDYADNLSEALDQSWDGDWYRRGYYDDGTPLGSRDNKECRIASIAQSWSVMAGSGNRAHAAAAMAAVDRLLVDHPHRIVRLFNPPFDRETENPGYIKGYPPGVRENGGQYTHGAIWSIFAWAKLGDGDRAGEHFTLLNPIYHSDSEEAAQRYRVEPYVSCADVYSTGALAGRGGWTWYSGSAAWLYRAGLEAILGFRLCGDQLRIDPCIPKHWDAFKMTYQHRHDGHAPTVYDIHVENPDHVSRGVVCLDLDGAALVVGNAIALTADGQPHLLRVRLG